VKVLVEVEVEVLLEVEVAVIIIKAWFTVLSSRWSHCKSSQRLCHTAILTAHRL